MSEYVVFVDVLSLFFRFLLSSNSMTLENIATDVIKSVGGSSKMKEKLSQDGGMQDVLCEVLKRLTKEEHKMNQLLEEAAEVVPVLSEQLDAKTAKHVMAMAEKETQGLSALWALFGGK